MKLTNKQIAAVYLILFNLGESKIPSDDKRYEDTINQLLAENNQPLCGDIIFDNDDYIHGGVSEEINKEYQDILEDLDEDDPSIIFDFLNNSDPTVEGLYNTIRKHIPNN